MKDAKVGQPEVMLGIIPGAGGTQRLPRLCGVALALQMSTDGKPVAAPKAMTAGIIDHIVDAPSAEREALSRAAIAFAKSKAGQIRKTREIPQVETVPSGLQARVDLGGGFGDEDVALWISLRDALRDDGFSRGGAAGEDDFSHG